jgi:Tol biopolymer transport system component
MAISPDGELVAFTRRTDEGSALLIGSMLDRSDPLQVYSSQHRIDHLHWSPVGTALLFSVLPTVSHAAVGDREKGRLMLLDLQDLSIRELYRSDHAPEDTPARLNDALNIT